VNWDQVIDKVAPVQTGNYPALGFDPLSGLGRGIDAGIGGAKIAGGEVYHLLTDDKGNPPASAAQTFSGRLAGRAAS
jgi:hypothetical protein